MMASSSNRVVVGDAINFDRLNLTLQHAVEREDKYYRENDAKFRAVAQKVQSYEEFEDIVKASHIKPMTEDVTQLELKRSSWSTSGREKERERRRLRQDAAKPKLDINRLQVERPQDFDRAWNSCTSNNAYYQLLLAVGGKQLHQLFKAGLGLTFLDKAVEVLDEYKEVEDKDDISLVLRAFGRTERFELTLDLLSERSRQKATALLRYVKQGVDEVELGKLKRGWSLLPGWL
eukprot:TRINITY_DN5680_c0_g1_i1.p1 TRINITY_DN5680_c0_g1~~TRINITY_DN5680_c0_g1_i1.p1  ORF type:complete len:233 (+),score=36.31 TRINITY_DN5680_c0_g1_i1:125-823(+)